MCKLSYVIVLTTISEKKNRLRLEEFPLRSLQIQLTTVGYLGMPVRLCVTRLHLAQDHLHSLARQRVELLGQSQDLVGFDFFLVSDVNETNKDTEK